MTPRIVVPVNQQEDTQHHGQSGQDAEHRNQGMHAGQVPLRIDVNRDSSQLRRGHSPWEEPAKSGRMRGPRAMVADAARVSQASCDTAHANRKRPAPLLAIPSMRVCRLWRYGPYERTVRDVG